MTAGICRWSLATASCLVWAVVACSTAEIQTSNARSRHSLLEGAKPPGALLAPSAQGTAGANATGTTAPSQGNTTTCGLDAIPEDLIQRSISMSSGLAAKCVTLARTSATTVELTLHDLDATGAALPLLRLTFQSSGTTEGKAYDVSKQVAQNPPSSSQSMTTTQTPAGTSPTDMSKLVPASFPFVRLATGNAQSELQGTRAPVGSVTFAKLPSVLGGAAGNALSVTFDLSFTLRDPSGGDETQPSIFKGTINISQTGAFLEPPATVVASPSPGATSTSTANAGKIFDFDAATTFQTSLLKEYLQVTALTTGGSVVALTANAGSCAQSIGDPTAYEKRLQMGLGDISGVSFKFTLGCSDLLDASGKPLKTCSPTDFEGRLLPFVAASATGLKTTPDFQTDEGFWPLATISHLAIQHFPAKVGDALAIDFDLKYGDGRTESRGSLAGVVCGQGQLFDGASCVPAPSDMSTWCSP